MKKSILTLMILLVCIIQPSTAYEYFTIYFSNGTKSEAFYATDVDSICYSKLSLDGIGYDEWQVQEIYTCDSVYRYSLAQIDSLIFKDVDVNKVAEDYARISSFVNPLYLQCNSSSELAQKLSDLEDVDGIEDVWTDSQSLFVKLRNWGVISYSYYPHNIPSYVRNNGSIVPNKNMARRAQDTSEFATHKYVNIENVCVITQMIKDKNFEEAIATSDSIVKICKEWGFNVTVNNDLKPEFFINGIRQYDIVFLMTHGMYDGNHWLVTNEEIYSQTLDKPVNEDSLFNVANEFIKSKYLEKGYSLKDISFSKNTIENRNGKKTLVCYTCISNSFISKHKTPKSSNIVVFNTACQSMKGNNPKLADAFINTGTDCYTGFTESNSIGPWTYEYMCKMLLNGCSIYDSYNLLPEELYTETVELPENSGQYVYPKLILWPENKEKTSICITHPETLPAEFSSNGEESIVKLRGTLKCLYPDVHVKVGISGISLSKSPDMTNSQSLDVNLKAEEDKHLLIIDAALNENQLDSNTTYYYRAYMNDGLSNCYGEIKQFTTKGDNGSGTGEEDTSDYKLYWVDSDNYKVRTYYYDNKYFSRMGYVTSDIHCSSSSLVKVILDNSLKKYKGLKEIYFNCRDLESIVGLDNLNTENIERVFFSWCESLKTINFGNFDTSNMTSMAGMFSYCSSLTSLDLSGFNTSNVTDMASMFECCISLTSLDLSSFNTSNVTNMARMFSYCSSLTSLDLSSFNTSNVTNMATMFFMCNSMTNFNLSSFDTKNVEDMYGMFEECNLLSSLDLSNFNTKNVKDIVRMFAYCSSLTILDLSSFNIVDGTRVAGIFWECSSLKTIYAGNWSSKKITSDRSPFCGCNNLVGGKGTKIGKNIYGYYNENPLYYYCGDDGEAMHIDGGKDWPGLFTAK